jgi:hypothetical protein
MINLPVFFEFFGLSKMLEEFSTLHKVHDKENFFRGLESIGQINQERVVDFD